MVLAIIVLLGIKFVYGSLGPPICGKSQILSRTYEDEEVSRSHIAEFLPFVASVQRFHPEDWINKNGDDIFNNRLTGAFVGTILGPTAVLVACRCVASRMGLVTGGEERGTLTAKQFGVMAGTPWDYSPVGNDVGQIRFASRIIVHPKCELFPSVYLWDLAVLVLPTPFEFVQGKVEAAPIPEDAGELKDYLIQATHEKLTCFTAGWGWSFNSHKPKHLDMKLHPLLVREFSRCKHSGTEYYASHGDIAPSDIHVCVETAASFIRLQRTGDVGSPLLGFLGPNEKTNKVNFIVLGIKSEDDDATPDGFSLFTRLDVDLEWILDIKKNPPSADSRDSASATNVTFELMMIVHFAKIVNIFGR